MTHPSRPLWQVFQQVTDRFETVVRERDAAIRDRDQWKAGHGDHSSSSWLAGERGATVADYSSSVLFRSSRSALQASQMLVQSHIYADSISGGTTSPTAAFRIFSADSGQ